MGLRTDSPNQKTQAYHNNPTRKRRKSAASKIQHNHNVDADHPRIKPSPKTKEPNVSGIGHKLTKDPAQKKKKKYRQHPARPVRYQGHRTGTDPCQQTTNCKSTTHLLDELDVDNTPHYHHRIEQITYRLIHIKQSQETANGRGSRHTISISLTTTRTLIKQTSVQNTPYSTVAKKGGTDDVRGKSVPYCRKQDLASQDEQQTIGNITEAILATDGPKWSFYDHHLTDTLCPLPFEKFITIIRGTTTTVCTVNRIFKKDSNTVAQTNPIEHHGKQFQ